MKKPVTGKKNNEKKEMPADLKAQATDDKAVKKGYNEKNPTQPQGAFKTDSSSSNN